MLLLYIYIASLITGSILLSASLFLGDHDSDVDADADVDVGDADVDVGDADADVGDADHDLDAHGDAGEPDGDIGIGDFLLPFMSLRFWVFFLTFFGLTGSVLAFLGLAGPTTTLVSSIAMGTFSGYAAAVIIRKLRGAELGSVGDTGQLKGLEGEVLIPLSADSRGKIRLMVGGSEIDMLARSDEPEELPIGSRVLVIDVTDSEALVVKAPAALSTTNSDNK